jgi:hypothetical protein
MERSPRMAGVPSRAEIFGDRRHRRCVPILLQKSPRGRCRIEMRNNRIAVTGFLNHNCEFKPDPESMLLARTLKILLQHYLPRPDMLVFLPISSRLNPTGSAMLYQMLYRRLAGRCWIRKSGSFRFKLVGRDSRLKALGVHHNMPMVVLAFDLPRRDFRRRYCRILMMEGVRLVTASGFSNYAVSNDYATVRTAQKGTRIT